MDVAMLINRLLETEDKTKDWRGILSRLEILNHVLLTLGYDESKWKWPSVFDTLIAPGLLHTNPDVRRVSIDIVTFLMNIDESGVNSRLAAIDGLKHSMLTAI